LNALQYGLKRRSRQSSVDFDTPQQRMIGTLRCLPNARRPFRKQPTLMRSRILYCTWDGELRAWLSSRVREAIPCSRGMLPGTSVCHWLRSAVRPHLQAFESPSWRRVRGSSCDQ
jgi:hypothetical protein